MAKRACGIFIYDEKERAVVETAMLLDDGKHWKLLLQETDEFKEDSLDWLDDYWGKAQAQLLDNGYTVVIDCLDFTNPMTKRRLIDNGK